MIDSQFYFSRPLPAELDEEKNWKARAYSGAKKELFYPGSAIKTMLLDAASMDDDEEQTARLLILRAVRVYGNMQFQDRGDMGKKLYLKDLVCKMHYVNPEGKREWPKTKLKYFACLPLWSGSICLHIANPKIDDEYVRQLFNRAGAWIGLGSMRLQNGGNNGAFVVSRLYRPRAH